ncbi:hypothetical protein HPP92_005290 [Vanilla planifolia]|uniref:Uncharacterized protein n=1 Tax=Vanilla planifolia TaxID=51239 RepID=A0A835RTS8_VANPL|nr:hypothetical protein HPP92_005290 [Vanilla planifolia]
MLSCSNKGPPFSLTWLTLTPSSFKSPLSLSTPSSPNLFPSLSASVFHQFEVRSSSTHPRSSFHKSMVFPRPIYLSCSLAIRCIVFLINWVKEEGDMPSWGMGE